MTDEQSLSKEFALDIIIFNLNHLFEISSLKVLNILASKVDNIWNHPFLEMPDSSNVKCNICNDIISNHKVQVNEIGFKTYLKNIDFENKVVSENLHLVKIKDSNEKIYSLTDRSYSYKSPKKIFEKIFVNQKQIMANEENDDVNVSELNMSCYDTPNKNISSDLSLTLKKKKSNKTFQYKVIYKKSKKNIQIKNLATSEVFYSTKTNNHISLNQNPEINKPNPNQDGLSFQENDHSNNYQKISENIPYNEIDDSSHNELDELDKIRIIIERNLKNKSETCKEKTCSKKSLIKFGGEMLNTSKEKYYSPRHISINNESDNYFKDSSESFRTPDDKIDTNEIELIEIREKKKCAVKKSDNHIESLCFLCEKKVEKKIEITYCKHFFCLTCIIQYLKEKITEAKENFVLKCPVEMCTLLIKEEQTLILLTNYNLFQLLSLYKNQILKNNLNYCPCPVLECFSQGNKNNILNGVLICENGHDFCIFCRKAPHDGKICSSYIKNVESRSSSDHPKKKCPKCFNMIEKIQQSNLIICSGINCGYKFCWICMDNCTKAHYINPISTCFGLEYASEIEMTGNDTCIRKYKWVLIVLLAIFILPVIFALFSFACLIGLLIYSELTNYLIDINFLNAERKESFRKFSISFYFLLGLPLLSFGYVILGILIITSPIWIIVLCVFHQKRKIENS